MNLTTTFTAPLPGTFKQRLDVRVVLHHLNGNEAPHFSVTGVLWEYSKDRSKWVESVSGCVHDLILRHFPHLADVVALHLSTIHGTPMYAQENGWYWLAGASGGQSQAFHGGNNRDNRSADDCVHALASHLRITSSLARELALWAWWLGDPKVARERFRNFVTGQYPRWRLEAERVIRKYSLEVVHG